MEGDDIREMFAALGTVSIRRMFGGKGIYHEGIIVAIDLFDEVMLKADAIAAADLAAAGSRQWVYQRPGGPPVAMPYWTVPDAAYDDPEEMARWVRASFEAALRAEAQKRQKGAKARKR